MAADLTTVLLWTAALSSGLIAGVYFAFSGFIMQAFSRIDENCSIAAMNSINTSILKSLFMPLFFGSTIVSVLLIVVALVRWGEVGAAMSLTAGVIYLLGMFVCTVLFNVPLNNALSKVQENGSDAHQVWSRYLTTWTKWNHLRTVCSIATCAICIGILSAQ